MVITTLKLTLIINMTTETHEKTVRLEARVSAETKALLQKAADLQGCTLTDFVISTVQAEALRVIEQHQILKLSLEDSQAFIDALLNPPSPNEALKRASVRHTQIITE